MQCSKTTVLMDKIVNLPYNCLSDEQLRKKMNG